MAYGNRLRGERTRRRRRVLGRAFLWFAGAVAIGGIGYSSYLSGSVLAELETASLRKDVGRLTEQLATVRQDNEHLRADLAKAGQATDAIKRRYDTDVPTGRVAELVKLTRDRLADGVPDTRLSQVLREVEVVKPCEGRFTRKRFAIQTAGQGTEDRVSLLDGLIQVSATAPAGAEDMAKAATVTILRAWAAQPLTMTGLPVRQSIVLNNAELKLVVEPSDIRGYGVASLSLCGKG